MSPWELEKLAQTMAKNHVARLYWRNEKGMPLTIELHPSAFASAPLDKALEQLKAEPEPDFLFASSLPVTKLETEHLHPDVAASKP